MHKPMLSCSMMCASLWSGAEKVLAELEAGSVELLHADVMDGVFVPNMMLGTDSIKQLRKISSIPLDIHLMIEQPEDKLGWFDLQPGEWVSIHAESTRHLQRALMRVREYGAKPMVALNPATPLSMIEEVLCDVDGVLLMTVNPGFAGQKLVPQTVNKNARLRKMLDENGYGHVRIEVDGNVSFENLEKLRTAGADIFVGGTSSMFRKDHSVAENVALLRKRFDEIDREFGL
ncbi:MAG: ribulose-phosphate 3-epimerase [Oscillospiraceae bacterium]|nr:ribulose-phosphate 3-epimerase [Oscillospiraceae bacterium]